LFFLYFRFGHNLNAPSYSTLSPSRARKGEHILAIAVRFKGKDQRENRPPFGRRSGECFYRNSLDFCSTQNPVRMFKNKSEFGKLFS
jgi:hypothetical protein